ncbi:MAG: DUF1593 domain-containing protein [Planctomycetales bacterium]|nr:DUF1593 domain-containing protein [Planctomycetales bacterium]
MYYKRLFSILLPLGMFAAAAPALAGEARDQSAAPRPRVIVTSDGEIDDECSLVRFLLYANEFDVEAIVTSSSQYHSHGHNWAGDDWIEPYLDAYAQVYPNLVQHDPAYPSPKLLRERTALGNVKAEGDMDQQTAGSQLIVRVLLDDSDDRPIWLQAWGGPNTIARALKTIEEDHPERMAEVVAKLRFFFIWEQDATYQDYIRPHWGQYNIPTIISDQFEAIAYRWKDCQPRRLHKYFAGPWMTEHILQGHGPLCSLYKAHTGNDDGFAAGDFRSEGDSPAFIHQIPTGLRSTESPNWGGWGGRYVRVRDNTWLDPVPVTGYSYPAGRWYADTAWGRNSSRTGAAAETNQNHLAYFRPVWRWSAALQNDFAARADWCVNPPDAANHPPVVRLTHDRDLTVRPGETVALDASETADPDGDAVSFCWWRYAAADSYDGAVPIAGADQPRATTTVPAGAQAGQTIHIVCEATDAGAPPLTRYQRVVLTVEE